MYKGGTTNKNDKQRDHGVGSCDHSILTVQDILNLFGRVIVTIEPGGELVIDGGVVTNAVVNLTVGSKLTIKNGGKLIMRTGTDFEAPTGALIEIENGAICRSNDF